MGITVQEVDKKTEFRSFLLLAFLLAPAITIAIVGGYGFIVWISQMIFGPPG
ncbi:periplasmic nitrate reductase, NapE protein [Seongchinamella unica]|uniref:Periplasmic nitrate reductase, NapE protein n=1 Tax=Seongchinamella unica TaxID=2547392 RepID=A0A4R5LQ07_9GAMM|nr:periplasmic nitrate reductase, NapE protein [Seongchinamella unica]